MLSEAMRRSLAALRATGEPVPAAELACRLLAIEHPPHPGLARRLVAGLLGEAPEALPEPLPPERLRPAEERTPLEDAAFAVVDLETTGLSAERHAILEIGAVCVRRLHIVSRFETLVRPPGPGSLSRAIVALTGIDETMVREAPPAPRALAHFARWLREAPGAPWVAHNAAFDHRFLVRAYRAWRGGAPEVAVLCSQKLGRRLIPRLGRYNLDHLCAHFGIANRARHRALGDAEATARLWIELLALAGREGVASVGELLDLQHRPLRRRRGRGRR